MMLFRGIVTIIFLFQTLWHPIVYSFVSQSFTKIHFEPMKAARVIEIVIYFGSLVRFEIIICQTSVSISINDSPYQSFAGDGWMGR
jgi:hypothetical protein